ncbi:helix-turn-helix transcriptional regulator [Sporosarcina limicola]|uniref:Transcriptional regulator YheO n=1 Tax=Sporosarcina limicola TaxID=34101 RepID=A0A927MNK4_9BACL|nr:PAS domain-containing protein [Sporosarcina limicola]MBE1554724.1 putative transcriptional regulator YheO [Sporosarcina limicola]
MLNNVILEQYKPLAKYIFEIVGADCEVILHDTNQPDSSIIALEGNLSNRSLGGPLTDLALEVLQSKRFLTEAHITNYKSTLPDGRICRSSSYYIKDNEDKLIGILCINVLVSDLIDIRNKIDGLIGLTGLSTQISSTEVRPAKQEERLGQNIDELMSSLISEVLSNYDGNTSELSPREKEYIIAELEKKGVFLLKGGVMEVAKSIEMSEPSVYRYLAKIKQ